MSRWIERLGWLAVAIIAFFFVREFLPRTETIYTPPEIITRWDTVTVLDSVEVVHWRDRWRERTDTFEVVREVLITVTDTVYRLPLTIGVSALDVRQAWGDTMIVRGFQLEGDTSAIFRRDWRADYFVAGPLRSLIADTIPPRVEFWPPPERCKCGFWTRMKWLGYGAVACEARHAVTGGDDD